MASAETMQAHGLDYNSATLFQGSPSFHQKLDDQVEQLLTGWPSRYTGERVWTGPDMLQQRDKWTVLLSEQEHDSIVKALQFFQGLGLGPDALNPQSFPLPPELSARLRRISHDCHEGRGFVVLRGLRTEDFTDEENVLVFGGLSSHVAPVRGFQDINRELVTCHVISEDTRPGAKDQQLRPAFTNGRLAFHTDLGDILTLFNLGVSQTGGKTMIVSSSQVYNTLAASRPDLLKELGEKWVFSNSMDYHTDGTPLVMNAPGDRLIFQYSRLPITGFRNTGANPSLPPVSSRRLEAMALVEEIAWENALPLPCERGDIAFINNLCLMHARTPFDLDADGAPLPSARHLVKLMLRDPEMAWEVPRALNWQIERVYGPNRGEGGRKEKWHLSIHDEKMPEGRMWAGSGSLSNG